MGTQSVYQGKLLSPFTWQSSSSSFILLESHIKKITSKIRKIQQMASKMVWTLDIESETKTEEVQTGYELEKNYPL